MSVNVFTFLVDYDHILSSHLTEHPVSSQFFPGTTVLEITRLIHETITQPDQVRLQQQDGSIIYTKAFAAVLGWNFYRQAPCSRLRVVYKPHQFGFNNVIATAFPLI